MKNMIVLLLLLLPGCTASSHRFATIGDVDFYTVKSPSLLGPSINMVVTIRTNETTPVIQGQAAGNGAVNAAVSAGGFVGGAAMLRRGSDNIATVDFIGPRLPSDTADEKPIAIGNPKNTRPFTHTK